MSSPTPQQIRFATIGFWVVAALGFLWSVARNALLIQQRWDGQAGSGIATIDFDVFVQASQMFVQGQTQCLYDRTCIQAAQKAAGFTTELMSWNYPPLVALLIAPFHGIDPKALYFGFLALNGLLAASCGWMIARQRGVILAFAFEPVLATMTLGQTSLITAGLLFLATRLVAQANASGLPRSRVTRLAYAGGSIFALLAIKPHMAWTAPIVALSQRTAALRRHVTLGGVIAGTIFVAISLWWPGPEAWAAFVHGLSQAGEALAKRDFVWQQMPTPFVTLSALGTNPSTAYGGQLLCAALAAAAVSYAWRRCRADDAAAITIVATALGSPYLYHYDLVGMGIGVALYVRDKPWTWTRGAIAYLALVTPLIGVLQNDIGSVMGDNHWRILPMAPMLIGLFALMISDARKHATSDSRVRPTQHQQGATIPEASAHPARV